MTTDPYRPLYHFTPPQGWTNDPNGLIYWDGEYHLFYQHLWPRHWGHTVSQDLTHWTHLPVALAPDELGGIWSGSVVADERDTSGLFGGGAGLVAVFTHQRETPNGATQSQSLAFSTDRGRTWIKYPGNPVLSSANPDFRDPKVFWHTETECWVMILATGPSVSLYTSPDLKSWTLASEFVPGGDPCVCECPDLFTLAVDGGLERRKWVLHYSWLQSQIFSEGQGASGMGYFVGDFDGRVFTPDPGQPLGRPSSYGPDDYAAVTWADAPGDRLLLGWMNHWLYAERTPTGDWQGAMTLPRELGLRTLGDELRLVQKPVRELQTLRREPHSWSNVAVSPGANLLASLNAETFEIIAEIEPGTAGEFGFRLRQREPQSTTIGYDVATSTLFVDRRHSGLTDFSPAFPSRTVAPLPVRDGTVRLHLFVDRCSVEVFGNDGEVYLAALIFPEPGSNGIEFYVSSGEATLRELQFFSLAQPEE